MTDGKSQEKDKTCESAKNLRNSGVIIIVIIIGNKVDMEEIQCIASGPSFIFSVRNFSGLNNRGFRDRVARKVFSGMFYLSYFIDLFVTLRKSLFI